MIDDLTNQPKIMCVGANFFDIVQTCKEYAKENTTTECISTRHQRGGNASNSSTVISQFDYPVELLTVFGDCDFSDFLKGDLRRNNIEFSRCPTVDNQGCPISTVTLSESTGSRTIVYHAAGIRELTLQDFQRANLKEYSWIHFEGRNNEAEIILMMELIKNYNKLLVCKKTESDESRRQYLRITISVELEQPDHRLLCLLPHADVVFISKEFAATLGCNCMSEGIKEIRRLSEAKMTIINTWGDKGATGSASDGEIVESAAFSPTKVIDTLGAGDTFNAAVLYFLNKAKLSCHEQQLHTNVINESEFIDGHVLKEAITFGCRVAGIKVGIRGYSGLKTIYEQT